MKLNLNELLLDKLVICQLLITVKNKSYKIPAYFDLKEVKKSDNDRIDYVNATRVFDPEKYLSNEDSFTQEYNFSNRIPDEIMLYIQNKDLIENHLLRH